MAYRDVILADRPVVFWLLSDSSSSVRSPDLAKRGGPVPTHSAVTYGAPGLREGSANSFVAGSWSHMTASGVPDPGDTMSYEIWIKRETTGITSAIISSVNGGIYLRFDSNNTIHMLRSQVVSALNTPSGFGTGTWIYLVCTNHPTIGRALWINGVQVAFTGGVSTGFSNSGTLYLNVEGASGPIYDPGTQKLWGFAVYNYVLSTSQIRNHYQTGLSGTRSVPSTRERLR